MNLFEPSHIIILAIVVLVLFGAKKIPEFMRGVGQGVGELQKGLNDVKRNMSVDQEHANTQPAVDASKAAQLPASSTDNRGVQA